MRSRLHTCGSVTSAGKNTWPIVLITSFSVAALALTALAQTGANNAEVADNEAPQYSSPEDPKRPRWHFRVREPARLSDEEAEKVYRRLKWRLSRRYKLSRLPVARYYQRWRRYNKTPYRSTTHGKRYVNNYANGRAHAYGTYEKAGKMPVGAILAKDSITVKRDGRVIPGPLFIMQKMSAGFSYVSGDWRYTMVMPDGSVFGETKGTSSERVEFCISCHLAAEKNDHLFFMPKKYRNE